ncbi:hypothetical protein [Bacteroides oleiciplenus]|uniref:Uncharacterized protein n=1 Tax=Bacteroides oleiciplenus TaxID=626931 RepID=A0A3E5B8K4_9BACE|nr:hypothetical protein [Bacteroides oleiciplenus]RGN33874.1 hypothetical protein DXB65_15465 [Bacteroides oleiciplenus]
MEFTKGTIKTGQSVVGGFRMDYSVTYDGEDKVSKIDAQVKRLPGEKVVEIYSGYATFNAVTSRYQFQLTSSVTSDERKALFNDFENTIAELIK